MTDVTRIQSQIQVGNPSAAAALLPLVCKEFPKLAAQMMTQEHPGQTLQATALVHEAYMRLVDGLAGQAWNGRGHFFGAAAEAMRRILVEQARRRNSLKRGGDQGRQELHDVEWQPSTDQVDLIALDEALTRLAEVDPQAARFVQLRYFAGLSMEEAAELLEIAPRSAYYLWSYARSWLRRSIDGSSTGADQSPPSPNI